ncbi:MAG: FHA domain-containing protein [Dokdonella sp.]|uniref:FHA domain-containing protein n=1 Tax=Dokdonella sp. TaxID=2291710 RepID=UPI0025BB03E4|nr:FHA domain-containing protein [Dokdonella sp.]MBZ0221578.1 FHA domain-containing protein [Dokdonella sp.]MCC7254571.1 FHA domain-containing protein [Dokdonella sp.]
MRLSFANGERSDLVVTAGGVNLGSANGNDVVLERNDVSPWHARIAVDARGIVLQVLDPAAQTHVNARPVREKALLHLGDTVHLGQVTLTIKADSDRVGSKFPTNGNGASTSNGCVVLRGLTGAQAGKAISIGARAVVGSDSGNEVFVEDARVAPRHATIELVGREIWLHSLGAGQGAAVNGIAVLDARLQPGDQISFARQRFLVEAPGMLGGAAGDTDVVTMTSEPAQAAAVEEVPEPSGGAAIWWLLGGAAAIAIALYLLLQGGI